MIKIHITLIGILLSMFILQSTAQEQSSVKPIIMLHSGDYLLDDYIKVLVSTHSPRKASEGLTEHEWVNVRYNGGRTTINFFVGFHVIDALIILNNEGKVVKNDFHRRNASYLEIKNDKSFAIINKDRVAKYLRVDSLNVFVNSNTVAGVYKDGAGKSYTFTKEGLAHFPDRSFSYVVRKDYTTHISYDMLVERRKTPGSLQDVSLDYIYEIDGKELRLFKLDPEASLYKPAKNPFLILRRTD
jgi:hypothetical protein